MPVIRRLIPASHVTFPGVLFNQNRFIVRLPERLAQYLDATRGSNLTTTKVSPSHSNSGSRAVSPFCRLRPNGRSSASASKRWDNRPCWRGSRNPRSKKYNCQRRRRKTRKRDKCRHQLGAFEKTAHQREYQPYLLTALINVSTLSGGVSAVISQPGASINPPFGLPASIAARAASSTAVVEACGRSTR